jgi:hypothetical protein
MVAAEAARTAAAASVTMRSALQRLAGLYGPPGTFVLWRSFFFRGRKRVNIACAGFRKNG